MKKILILRYLFEKKYYLLFVSFVFIASFSCGAFSGGGAYVSFAGDLLLKRLLPEIVMTIGGLFWLGNFFIAGGICFEGFFLGQSVAFAFENGLGSGLLFIFLVLIPCGTLYAISSVLSAMTAFECNFSRMKQRRNGIKRKMTAYEIKQYSGKEMISSGIMLAVTMLESFVFGSAFVSITGI